MKNFIIIVTISILSLLDFHSAAACSTPIVTDCLAKPTKRSNDKKIEITVLYSGDTIRGELSKLSKFMCSVQSKLPNTVTVGQMVGANVPRGENGIDCQQSDTCEWYRSEACILKYEATAKGVCAGDGAPKTYVDDCEANKESDELLIKASDLRCSLGIDGTKLPVLVFDQQYYDPCANFNSEDDLLKFVCDFYEDLPGC